MPLPYPLPLRGVITGDPGPSSSTGHVVIDQGHVTPRCHGNLVTLVTVGTGDERDTLQVIGVGDPGGGGGTGGGLLRWYQNERIADRGE